MKIKLIAVTQPVVQNIRSLEQLIEHSGRKCTATCEKTGQNTARFLKARVKQGHTSILEHANFTFEIDGISRSCLAQLTRHRIASYSVESMRYVNQIYSDTVMPDSIMSNPAITEKFITLIATTKSAYNIMIKNGIPQEDARYILPIATQTSLVLTMNLRELLHFFSLRTGDAAQWEIQELANRMKNIVMEYCPNVFT